VRLHVLAFLSGYHQKQKKDNQQKGWAKSIYIGNETRQITEFLKNTNVKVTYTTTSNLGKLLNTHKTNKWSKYDMNGVYELKCPTCHKKYFGQTGGPFHMRFREHYNKYTYANNRSKFTQHIDEGHTFGPINDVMSIVSIEKRQFA
jgi:ABC-type Fe3+/spermidine/putrescine transport system ATPase subunit